MLIITDKMLQQYAERKGKTSQWVIKKLFPKPPIFVSHIVLDLSQYSESTQARFKNVVSGFITFTARQLFINDIIKRIDYKEKVPRSDIRLAFMLSLYINDGIFPPYDIRFSDIERKKLQDRLISFSRRFKYIFKGKELSPSTVTLFIALSHFEHKSDSKIVKRARLSFSSSEQKKIGVFKNKIEKNIKIVLTKKKTP